jgi:hypothetical protein
MVLANSRTVRVRIEDAIVQAVAGKRGVVGCVPEAVGGRARLQGVTPAA